MDILCLAFELSLAKFFVMAITKDPWNLVAGRGSETREWDSRETFHYLTLYNKHIVSEWK